MSIILKDPVTRQRILFCKGADSAILPRLQIEDEIILERTIQNLTMYAKQGLRTLVMAKREITGKILITSQKKLCKELGKKLVKNWSKFVNRFVKNWAKIGQILFYQFVSQNWKTDIIIPEISDEEYKAWISNHTWAENQIHGREKLLEQSYDRIEEKMSLIGASGIEDKLQEKVPSVIANLRSAGIIVWVLTGM